MSLVLYRNVRLLGTYDARVIVPGDVLAFALAEKPPTIEHSCWLKGDSLHFGDGVTVAAGELLRVDKIQTRFVAFPARHSAHRPGTSASEFYNVGSFCG